MPFSRLLWSGGPGGLREIDVVSLALFCVRVCSTPPAVKDVQLPVEVSDHVLDRAVLTLWKMSGRFDGCRHAGRNEASRPGARLRFPEASIVAVYPIPAANDSAKPANACEVHWG